jgi:hypothetical protein
MIENETTPDGDPLYFPGKCGPADGAYGPVGGIVACYNYLRTIGEKMCETTSSAVKEVCRSGGSHVTVIGWPMGRVSRSHL